MRRPQGYLKISDPIGETNVEQDSFSCGHCQRVSFVKPSVSGVNLEIVPGGLNPQQLPQLLGGLCKVCMRLMCPSCTAKREAGGDCDPFEKALKREESRNAFLKSMEL